MRLSTLARLGLTTSLAVTLALAPTAAGQEAMPLDDQAAFELGAARYAAFCARCHGEQAEGFQGPKLAGTQVPLAQMLKLVRESEGMMASFRPDQLSDEDVAEIYTYVRSLGGTRAMEPSLSSTSLDVPVERTVEAEPLEAAPESEAAAAEAAVASDGGESEGPY